MTSDPAGGTTASREAASEPNGLRLEPLRRWLAENVTGARRDLELHATMLTGGLSNVTYLLQQGEASWVLRRPPLGHVMTSAHDMGREHRVLSGLARVDFPAPRPRGLCKDADVIGAPFMLMDFVDGRIVGDQAAAATLTQRDGDEISAALVSTLSRLHDVDVVAAGLERLGRPEGYLARQVRRWSSQWEVTQTRPVPEVDELLGWLEARVSFLPHTAPWSLVHGDYRLDNLILGRTTCDVRAVLDWEMSTLGDPVADLAVTLVYWSRPQDVLRHRVQGAPIVTDGPGFWERDRVVERYAAESGRDLGYLDVCIALACLKLAVIVESIRMRSLQGKQIGTDRSGMESLDTGAATFATLGLEVAHGGGVAALSR